METTPRRSSQRLFFGLILVLIGGIFLLQQVGGYDFRNWWALFILIPAFGSFSSAWFAYQASGRLSEGVRAGIGGGLIVFVLALMFLFNLDWTDWWPLMIVAPGLTILFNGFTLPGSREATRPLRQRLYRPWTGWVGLGTIFLGMGFLLQNLGILEPAQFPRNWWALAIFFPAIGGVITAVRLLFSGEGLGWPVLSCLAAAILFGAVAAIAYVGTGWNLIVPIVLIAGGLVLLTGVFRRH